MIGFETPVNEVLVSVAVTVAEPAVVSATLALPVPPLKVTVAKVPLFPVRVSVTVSLSLRTVLPFESSAVTITLDWPPALTGEVALTASCEAAPYTLKPALVAVSVVPETTVRPVPEAPAERVNPEPAVLGVRL